MHASSIFCWPLSHTSHVHHTRTKTAAGAPATMPTSHFWHEFVAGTVGGVAGITIVYPLDTAKMRLQTYPHYKGMGDVIRTMVAKEGLGSLYRGLLSPQTGFGVTFAISFSGYAQGARFFRGEDRRRELTLAEMTAAGAWAGLLQSPARQVFERVKSVMQVQKAGDKAPYRWSGECVVQLIKKEGLYHGLFRGLDATIAREIPQFAVYYPAYELLVRALRKRNGQHAQSAPAAAEEMGAPLPPHLLLLAGGIAGTVQWLPPFYCIDVVKSRMQGSLPGVYSSAWDCAVKSYRQDGARVFFRGLPTALVRAFPLHACIFFGYESTMVILKDRELQPEHLPPE